MHVQVQDNVSLLIKALYVELVSFEYLNLVIILTDRINKLKKANIANKYYAYKILK